MEVSRIRALRGPNLWTRHTAIEAMVRCAPGLESDLSADQHAFEKRLRHLFPGLGRLQPGERDAHLSMELQDGGRVALSFRNLPAGVDPGIRAARGVDHDPQARDLPQGGFQHALHGALAGLELPAEKFRALVGQGEHDPHPARGRAVAGGDVLGLGSRLVRAFTKLVRGGAGLGHGLAGVLTWRSAMA